MIKRYLKITFFIALAVMSVFFIRDFILHKQEEDQLREHGRLTSGKVVSIGAYSKVNKGIRYEVQIEGKRYEFYKPYPGLKQELQQLIHKTFPVLYDPEHPDNNKILILPSDFDRFQVAFPDSLKWVRQL